jgi:hypothetical protein
MVAPWKFASDEEAEARQGIAARKPEQSRQKAIFETKKFFRGVCGCFMFGSRGVSRNLSSWNLRRF